MVMMIVKIMVMASAAAAAIFYFRYQTLFVKITYNNLSPRSKMKFTVVQLSDIHGQTRFINGSLSRMVNNLQPDYVVITGDLASSKKQLPRVLKELKLIKCRSLYFIPGNYEREEARHFRKRAFSAKEYEHILDSLRDQGITVLENKGTAMERNGKRLLIYGFDNSIYGNERMHMSKDDLLSCDYVILLAHSPTIIHQLEACGTPYDLLLTGHTHGGQIRVMGRTIGAYKNYHVGLKITEGSRSFYINRGLGTVKIPLRLACPPEIAVFRIGEQDSTSCLALSKSKYDKSRTVR